MDQLSGISNQFISFMVKEIGSISLNWIGEIVKGIIEGVGITSVGIILFTVILKTIVMPLDVFSKVKTKKQSLVMERMRPQMEKLQKQHANDKAVYNQKVMELYKKNGYSMVGVCLPTIVSLIIFLVVFSQFSTYSQYANLQLYNGMVEAYNAVAVKYVESSDNPEGFLVETADSDGETVFFVDFDKFETYYESNKTATDIDYSELVKDVDSENDLLLIVKEYIADGAREAAAVYYRANVQGFVVHNGWVGNIWYPDSMFSKEIPSFEDFASSLSRVSDIENYEESYNEITAYLTEEKDTYNGYFVLIVLAIGLMFLSQFVAMRMQKSMNELGTVDGTGKNTNRAMLIIMPLIYGLFSFFYSAGFSIYMITNTLYSLITSVIVSLAMNKKFQKLEERNELDKYLHKKTKEEKMRERAKKRIR